MPRASRSINCRFRWSGIAGTTRPCVPSPSERRLGAIFRQELSATVASLRRVLAGQVPGDDPALDLPGALEDVVDLGVAVPLLDGVAGLEGLLAEEDHRAVGHRLDGARGVGL